MPDTMKKQFDRETFKEDIIKNVRYRFRKTLEEASEQEIYQAVAYAIKDDIIDNWMETHKEYEEQDAKTVYYLSMEFLTGRALGNNLINLCCYEDVKEVLHLNYPAYGCGIRYKYGMFKQKIVNGEQVEAPDDWLKNGNPFEIKRPEYSQEVKFGGVVRTYFDRSLGRNRYSLEDYNAVLAVPYDIPIVGYNNGIVNSLRIWDAEPINQFNLDSFDKGDYFKAVEQENLASTLVEVLYPNDNHRSGKELRLKQQYFFVSASLQQVIKKFKENHDDIHQLPEKVVFQLNDTHPTIAVPELMRILMDEEFLEWDDAWDITHRCCAFTNHTIMSEALEKWPIDLFKELLPRIYQIVEEINRRFLAQVRAQYPGDEEKVRSMAVLYDGQVRMANMAIVAGFSVNGVAKLHTQILEKRELKDFYEMMPEKFSNKTNGITQRRFLLHANPELSAWITEKLGSDAWITDLPQIKKLEPLADDSKARKEFENIKRHNKERLAEYILEHNHIEVNPDSIFDIQAKRLHEYKRQLLNIMHIMYLYNRLKADPDMDFYPTTFIFGAKAAAGYVTAKQTIRLINEVANVINNDPAVNQKLKVVFIENYCVSNAEMLFAASNVSEQISTASREASGTGNMKFMLNGALTIGTMDGANVEMAEEVGKENMFIFGMSAEEVMAHEANHDYNPHEIYDTDQEIRTVMNQMVDGTYSDGDTNLFRALFDSLLNEDRYFVLKDFRSYAETQAQINEAFKNEKEWNRKAILNVANAGKFSSDRTIEEYVRDIWHLKKVYLKGEEEK